MTSAAKDTYLGKYREIILAVAFFILFDLAVLLLNFYISFQISEDALAINLAGRQRMLSQRMTKALLTAESNVQRGLDNTDALTEIKKTADLFDSTLAGFQNGTTVIGGDEKPVFLPAVTASDGRAILAKADALWRPYKELLTPITSGVTYSIAQFNNADRYARDNNLQLLALMNSLTTHLEQTANAKTDILRRVQTGGILLALLNFAFIVFKLLRRLRENDRKIEHARKETAEILDTVKEGLFLLDAKFRIGSQYSSSLQQILGRKVESGDDFRQWLQEIVPTSVYTLTCDYINLLFGDWLKESLIGDLNPLTELEITVPDDNGVDQRRFLTLQFNRVLKDGKVSHLLVTVFDVTAQVELERALADAKEKAKAETEVMIDLLKIDPPTLDLFLRTAKQTLLEINGHQRGALDYRSAIATIFRKIHALKGEAAALELEMFEILAQQFGNMPSELRENDAVSGDAMLPFPLEDFLQRVATVRDLTTRLAANHDKFAENLSALAKRVAHDRGKEVQVVTELDLLDSLPLNKRNDVKDIAVQLLRDVVTHGIESALEREVRAKPATGNIHIALKPTPTGEYELMMRHDGRDLSAQKIREKLVQSGRYTEEELNRLDERQIAMKIFEPGFSTTEGVSRDSGHGVGMDVVKNKVKHLGARLRVSSQVNTFTQFSIHFTA